MACKRGGSLLLQSISSSLLKNRNYNGRCGQVPLFNDDGKRTFLSSTPWLNKLEEQGIPTDQAKVLRDESIEKKLDELLHEIRAGNDMIRCHFKYDFEKEAGKLEHEYRQSGGKDYETFSEADKALRRIKFDIFLSRAKTNVAYCCTLSVFILLLAKSWL